MILLLAALGDGSHDAEAALERSAWVARITERALTTDGHDARLVAAPTGLRDALSASFEGVALYAHGAQAPIVSSPREAKRGTHAPRTDATDYTRPAILHRAGDPILDAYNLKVLSGRWAYAFACRSGVELAGQAVQQGCTCFVGYEVALQLDWNPEDLPIEVRADLERFLTATVRAIARGERDADAIGRALFALAEPVELWLHEHPGTAQGIEILLTQLKNRLVLRLPVPDLDE